MSQAVMEFLASRDLDLEKDPAICLVYNLIDKRDEIGAHREQLVKEVKRANRKKLKQLKKTKGGPKICAEGDSWINILHPWSSILGYHPTFFDIIQSKNYYNNDLAWPGHTFQQIYSAKQYKGPLKSGIFDFFVFSGGGNDVLGGGALTQILRWKQDGGGSANPADYIHTSILDGRIKTLRQGYLGIANEVKVWSNKTRMLVHGYDYPVPRRGEPWLGDPFTSKGYDLVADKVLIEGIIKLLVDSFYTMLKGVAQKRPNVTVVNLRNIVGDRWSDELHPKKKASKDLAWEFTNIIGPPA